MQAETCVKRVAIVCGYSFPFGMAPTTRIISYAKGLVENNIHTDIFVYFPTDREESFLPVDGVIDGVHYHYPGTRTYPKNKLIRIVSHAFYCFIAMIRLFREHRKQKFDFVIISTDWFRILYTFIPFVRMIKAKPIFIADEYPVPIRMFLKNSIPYWRKTLFKLILRRVEGMIFMTDNISNFYNDIVRKPSFILPTITDVSRFHAAAVSKDPISSKLHITYMGNMELSKDNVDNIIIAFSLISPKYPDLQLHLYGAPNQTDLKKVRGVINQYKLDKRVIFKGCVGNDEVPTILVNSLILVSSQPVTKRSQGGFPTKLGEYMASGIPTLLTRVGEIMKYVSDGVNVWLAEPDNPPEFAQKLEYIIMNYGEAMVVAERGKKHIIEHFDYRIQSAKLKEFLVDLNSNGS